MLSRVIFRESIPDKNKMPHKHSNCRMLIKSPLPSLPGPVNRTGSQFLPYCQFQCRYWDMKIH